MVRDIRGIGIHSLSSFMSVGWGNFHCFNGLVIYYLALFFFGPRVIPAILIGLPYFTARLIIAD